MSNTNSDSTISVSKGCFVFKKKKGKSATQRNDTSQEPWNKSYLSCWLAVQESYQAIETQVFSKTLNELILHVRESYPSSSRPVKEIPAAALIVGINMPDHASLFATLSQKLISEVTPHVATLWARDCTSIRSTVERMCHQFMTVDSNTQSNSSSGEESEEETHLPRVVRSQCTLPSLSSWYRNCKQLVDSPSKKKKAKLAEADKKPVEPLIVIISDIESFSAKVLQDFVLLLSGYQHQLPFFLVLGVATAISAIHRSLPHHVSSCVNVKLFHIKPSSEYLSEILEQVFFTAERRVHLGGKAFELLRSVFLCYDFSIIGFVTAYKYCLFEHFYEKNWMSLSCSPSKLSSAVKKLSQVDMLALRALLSARKYVEKSLKTRDEKIKWLKDDVYFKNEVNRLLLELHEYVGAFFATLRCLHVFTSDLSSSPVGRNLESIYSLAMSSDITEDKDFRECMKMFGFLSGEELQSKVNKVLTILQGTEVARPQLKQVTKRLDELSKKLKLLLVSRLHSSPVKSQTLQSNSSPRSPLTSLSSPSNSKSTAVNRTQFREKLRENVSHGKQKLSPFEELRCEILDCLSEELFTKFLMSPCTKPFHEIMFFDDEKSLKAHIIGSPRQAVFRALRDPHYYLQCQCCKLSSQDEILPTIPDVCIAYKLHLESGRLVNMFDWLQSFLTVVNPMDEEQTEVDPKLQARFTQAVAELQFLGFIKSSSRKTDHVTRITWG